MNPVPTQCPDDLGRHRPTRTTARPSRGVVSLACGVVTLVVLGGTAVGTVAGPTASLAQRRVQSAPVDVAQRAALADVAVRVSAMTDTRETIESSRSRRRAELNSMAAAADHAARHEARVVKMAAAKERAAKERAAELAAAKARAAKKRAAKLAAQAKAKAAKLAAEAKAKAAKRAKEVAKVQADPRSLAKTVLNDYGFGGDQFSCLDQLWAGESNWNYLAINPTSGAYGIPQSLPASKMAAVADDWRTNPETQIRWGLDYIKRSYGSPCGALGAWQSRSPHWY